MERRHTLADLLLVDGHALAFRAFFGFPNLYFTPEGAPVNAVQGFGSMLVNTIRTFDPDMVGVVFDAPGKSFRSDLFPEYKAQRPPVPGELTSQFPLMQEFLIYMGIPTVAVDEVEGDDVLASISVSRIANGDRVTILSPDKDLCQLLSSDGISLMKYDGRSGSFTRLTRERFCSDYGFSPESFCDYLALMGDSCDNVPGVKGIGKKTASTLVGEFGCLENIYDNLASLKPAARRKLEAGKDVAFLSRDLVTLKTDVALPDRLLASCCIDPDSLFEFCSSTGLGSLYSRCMGW